MHDVGGVDIGREVLSNRDEVVEKYWRVLMVAEIPANLENSPYLRIR